MTTITPSASATMTNGGAALKIMSGYSSLLASTTTGGKTFTSSADVYMPDTAGKGAVKAIMQIIMDNKGNTLLSINAKDATVTNVKTDAGNDTINVSADQLSYVDAGAGNDTISASADYIYDMNGGSGNDTITISAATVANNIYGGDGDDTINVSGGGKVGLAEIYGGDGNDTINIISDRSATDIYGGGGNDTIQISGKGSAGNVLAGTGNDSINIAVDGSAGSISGGKGSDGIEVSANEITAVAGGRGDDTIVLHNKGNEAATYYFAQGDGSDTVETDGALAIYRFSDDGSKTIGWDDASITNNDDGTISIGFANSSDSIKVKLTGDLANASNISIGYTDTGALLIQDENNAIQTPKALTPLDGIVGFTQFSGPFADSLNRNE